MNVSGTTPITSDFNNYPSMRISTDFERRVSPCIDCEYSDKPKNSWQPCIECRARIKYADSQVSRPFTSREEVSIFTAPREQRSDETIKKLDAQIPQAYNFTREDQPRLEPKECIYPWCHNLTIHVSGWCRSCRSRNNGRTRRGVDWMAPPERNFTRNRR